MANGAQGVGAAGASFLLMQDVNNVLQNGKPLEEGARAEMAEELGTVAKEQEQEPSRPSWHYELTILRQGYRGPPHWTRREDGGQGRCARGPHEAPLGTKRDGGHAKCPASCAFLSKH